MQALGLANEYSCHNSLLKPFVQRMAALAFVPSTFVRPAWLAIQQTAPTTIPRVDDLVEYFTDTWLNGSFPQSQWNYFNQHLPRTNNHVEGWHSKIAKIIIQISTLGSSSFNGKKRWLKPRYRHWGQELLLVLKSVAWKKRRKGSRRYLIVSMGVPSHWMTT